MQQTYLIFLLGITFSNISFGQNTDSLRARVDTLKLKIIRDSANFTKNFSVVIDSIRVLNEDIEAIKKSRDILNMDVTNAKATKKTLDKINKSLDAKANDKLNQIRKLDSISKVYLGKIKISSDSINSYSDSIKAAQTALEIIKHANDSLNTITKSLNGVKAVLDSNIKHNTVALDSVRSLLEKIKDTLVVISEFKVKGKPFKICVGNSNGKQNATIQTAAQQYKADTTASKDSCRLEYGMFRIREGQVLNIFIYTDHGLFRNKRSPISLTTINEEREFDKLYLDGKSSDQFLYLKDVVKYTPRRSYSYIPYADVEFRLDGKDSIYFIKENTSLNAYVDVAAYTDINGISGDANGLAQVNMSGKFITSTKNIRNTAVVPFNFVSVEGYMAKFDDNFKGTPIDSVTKIVDRTRLFQTTYYRVGAKLNLLHWVLSSYPKRLIEDMQLNVGYNFAGSRLLLLRNKDTTGVLKLYDSTFKAVIQNQFYIEPIVIFTRNSNFGFTISLPLIYQSVKFSSGVANHENLWYASPTVCLAYYAKKTPGNKIFFRYSYTVDMKNPEQGFTQAQLGYSASLTDVFKL